MPSYSRGWALRCVLDVPEGTILKEFYGLYKTINPRFSVRYYIVTAEGLKALEARKFKDAQGRFMVEFPELGLTIPAK